MYNLLVPSLKITAPIFLEVFLIQYFIILVERSMTSSLPLFALYKNLNISKTKKDIPKRKTPFFFTLKTLPNKQLLFFTSYSTGQRDCSITRVQSACSTRTLHAVSTQCPRSAHAPYTQMPENACNYTRVISRSGLDIACKITRSRSTGTH